ncbi:hypothetical protein ACE3MS_29930 [Paenibacillus dendritiformis]|uniref:hypothetical protein n=1 Tax=Paenibacillus dendritiformis TaxID=130049 RepID=UPI003657F74A
MYTLYYFEHPFLLIASFFDSIIKKVSAVSNKLNLMFVIIINMLFNVFISVMVGGFLSILLFAFSMITQTQNMPSTSALMSVPLFMFTLLSCIIFLNGKNQFFSLPWYIFIFYGMFTAAKPKKHFIQTAIFLMLVTFILTFILIIPASVLFHPSKESAFSMVIATFSIAFITTVLLYSYGTLDTMTRVRRQFVLWFIILIGVLFFSAYQLKINLDEPLSNQIHTSNALLLFSFIYSMITVIDKGIELFKLLLNKHGSAMEEIWCEYTSRYGLDALKNKMIRVQYEISLLIEWIKFFWRTGATGVIIQYLLMTGLGFIGILGLCIYPGIPYIGNKFIRFLKYYILGYIPLTWEQIQHILPLIACIAFLIWNFSSIHTLRRSNWKVKSQILGRLLISIIIFLAVIIQTGLDRAQFLSGILHYVMLTFVFLIIIVSLIQRIHKMVNWFKS